MKDETIDKQRREIVAMERRGLTHTQIAQQIGVSDATVGNRLRRAREMDLRIEEEMRALSDDEIVAFCAEVKARSAKGYSAVEVAASLGVSVPTIAKRLERHRAIEAQPKAEAPSDAPVPVQASTELPVVVTADDKPTLESASFTVELWTFFDYVPALFDDAGVRIA